MLKLKHFAQIRSITNKFSIIVDRREFWTGPSTDSRLEIGDYRVQLGIPDVYECRPVVVFEQRLGRHLGINTEVTQPNLYSRFLFLLHLYRVTLTGAWVTESLLVTWASRTSLGFGPWRCYGGVTRITRELNYF